MKRLPRQRRFVLLVALVTAAAILAWLLWPLSSRQWAIEDDDEALRLKDEYLDAQRSYSGRFRSRGAASASPPPRIVLIVADDLALTDLSRYNRDTAAATPAIDSIGADGATFTAAHATTSICAPSRAALLTGRYQQRYGFELQPHDRYARNRLEYLAFRYAIDTDHMMPFAPGPIPTGEAIARQGLPPGEVTLAELLGARGYRTAAYGKWHLGLEEPYGPLARGFDEHYGFYEAYSLYAPVDDPEVVDTPIDDFSDRHMWSTGRNGRAAIVHNDEVVEEDGYLTFRFAELAADYIEAHAEDPFFLYLPFSAPHTPLQAPQRYYDRFDAIDDPVRRTYAAMIAAFDDAVATVLDAIDDAGIAGETIVIFTSDNGGASYLGVTDNDPFAGGKFTTFQGGIAVPLMIRYPDVIEPGSVYAEPVSLLDVFATVDAATTPGRDAAAESAGGAGAAGAGPSGATAADAVAPPGRAERLALDGVDLLPFLTGEAEGRPADALYWRSGYNKAVRRGEWKLIVTTDRSPAVAEGSARYELYNLRRDPAERVNVAAANPQVVTDLICRLNGWEGTLAEPLWPPVMHFWHDIWGRRLWFGI